MASPRQYIPFGLFGDSQGVLWAPVRAADLARVYSATVAHRNDEPIRRRGRRRDEKASRCGNTVVWGRAGPGVDLFGHGGGRGFPVR